MKSPVQVAVLSWGRFSASETLVASMFNVLGAFSTPAKAARFSGHLPKHVYGRGEFEVQVFEVDPPVPKRKRRKRRAS